MCEEININVNETNENINIISTEIVEVIDINVGETIEEVTLNITEEVIQVNINKVTGGGNQDLQSVTDNGNVTTNDIQVENANYFSIVQPSDVGTENKNTGAYAYIGADGVLGLNNGDIESTLKNTNVVNSVTLEFPDKPTGIYTIATTEDVTTPTLQQVTDEGATTTNAIETGNIIATDVNGGEPVLRLNYDTNNTNTIAVFSDANTGFSHNIDNSILTANRYIALPDASGTIALTSDIPAAQVNSDWNATSGVAEILNKPTIPSSSTFVPYTGATADLDLGTYNLTADHIALNVSPSGAGFVVGATEWNNTLGSSQTLLKGGNVTLKNGVDLVARIVNKVVPNTTLTKAAYQVVKVSGASGQRLAVDLARANTDLNSADTLGVVIETIATNQEGFIITVGQIEDINTTGSLQGETWADGDVLYLSPTTAGKITNVKPNGSNGHIVVIGYVEYSHSSQGKIYVKIMNGWELDELHNVYISSVANNQILTYESATQLWKNKNLNQIVSERRNANNTSNNNINYCGTAPNGSAESSTVWTITRLTIAASGSITTATATNVAWTNRQSATYI